MDYRKPIQDSLDYIDQNLKTEITAKELADRAGFSLFHYYRVFQSAVGIPVMQYILRRKLLHAIYDIHCGCIRIDTVLSYGFETYSGFYKAFQREFGCTPSTFLKKHRAKRPIRVNLLREEHMGISHKKAAKILKQWNMENEPITDIYYENNGNKCNSAFYVGESHVLKFTTDVRKVKNHLDLSKALDHAGLNAAVPIESVSGQTFIKDGSVYYYLTRRLQGKQILSQDMFGEDYAANAHFLGRIIGKLHFALRAVECTVNDVNLFQTAKDWALPKVHNILPLSDPFCREFLRTFSSLYEELPRQTIHRDPHPGNIILNGEKWGFLDFELSERNLRLFDPCYAATAILSESFADADPAKLLQWVEIYQNIIRGYDDTAALTKAERTAVPYVLLANQLICTAWFSEQVQYSELFGINKRMTLWLVDNFEKLRIL